MTPTRFDALIPPCPFGDYVRDVFPVGAGLQDDAEGDTPDTGYMRIVNGVQEIDFLSYCGTLTNAGFVCCFERDAEEGLYREFYKDENLVYAYFIRAEGRIRVILDNASLRLPDFEADEQKADRFNNTALMQYSLHYAKMIKGYSCDCGMLYAIRTRSGELILVDGGEMEQATDAAVADCVEKLRLLTGTKKLTVAAWYCSHPHNDHIDFFLKLLRVLGDEIELKRVTFNFPSHRLHGLSPYIGDCRRRIKEHSPDVKFLQLHAGMTFTLDGVETEVLHTHEDSLLPGGYDEHGGLYNGTNETCAVVRFTYEAGKSLLLLGDVGDSVADVLMTRYPKLSCTYLQASHHCINRVRRIYQNTAAETVLIPQGQYNLTRGCKENYRMLKLIYGRKRCLDGDETRVFFDTPTGRVAVAFPHVGSEYDGSEI